MALSQLKIDNFRNFQSIDAPLSSSCNVVYGENGAGKTSFLEAIYYLSMGKSFRTHLNSRVINQLSNDFTLRANICNNNITTPLLIHRERSGGKSIQIGGKKTNSIAAAAKLLPVQLLSNKSTLSLSEGPKARRAMLDWGVFHLTPPFLELWQRSQQIQKHRNVLLKQHQPPAEIAPWNKTLSDLAEQINQHRQNYIEELNPFFQKIIAQLLNTQTPLSLQYSRGWKQGELLEDILKKNHFNDCRLGYSQSGPHRADLKFIINNTPADDFLSQGQLKLAAYAFQLAQGQLHKERLQQPPTVLIDDLPAELDTIRRNQVLALLQSLQAQTFITCNNKKDMGDIISQEGTAVFHVKNGLILPETPLIAML